MTEEHVLRSPGLQWRKITEPTEQKLKKLQKFYEFHDLDLEDCLSKGESPKIEEHKDYIFIVFHFPLKDPNTDYIMTEPLQVFVGQDYLITLSSGRLKKLEDFFQKLKKKPQAKHGAMTEGSGYLLYLLINDLFKSYQLHLSQLSRTIREIEADIFEGKVMRDRLYDIMIVKRQIIALKRVLLPHASVISALENAHKRFITQQLELYFDDVGDAIARGKENLEEMQETIGVLRDANESLTSHNTNRTMKILTVISVTLLPLTFVTGLYGMNVDLPYAEHPYAFDMISAVIVILLLVSLLIFKFKRLL